MRASQQQGWRRTSRIRGEPETGAGGPARGTPSRPGWADPEAAPRGTRLSWWWATSAGAAALFLALALLAAIWLLARPLAFLILGIAIAQALSPLAERLERRLPRSLAVVAVYLGLVALLALIALVVVPALFTQLRAAAERLPALINSAEAHLDGWDIGAGGKLTQAMGRLGSAAMILPLRAMSLLVEAVLLFFISIYWLLGAPSILSFSLSFWPVERREDAARLLGGIGSAMGGYIRGAALNGLILGALFYLGLLVIGVPYALTLALLACVLEILPILGPIIAGAVMVAVALLQSPTMALIVLGFVITLQQLETHILVPNIMRSQTDVPPVFAVFALFAGGTVGGLLGALVAIPLAAALRVIALQVVAPAVRRRTGALTS